MLRPIILVLSSLILAAAELACNGSPELCNQRYSDVVFVGAHNSPFVGSLPTQNQYISVAAQLRMGVRMLQAQAHQWGDTIRLCHTSCWLLDGGTLIEFLKPIKSFMDANPHEVITLILTNKDEIPVTKFWDDFKSTGLDKFAYNPGKNLTMDEWPTMVSLLQNSTRLIVFMDFHSNTAQVPQILDQFEYFFETPYDETDPEFPQCDVDRPSGAKPDGRMYLVNHYLDIEVDFFGLKILWPDQGAAPTTNGLQSVTKQASLCNYTYGRMPNIFLLDYIDQGNAMEAQKRLNDLE